MTETASVHSDGYLVPGRWMSIYELARSMHRTVRWVRIHIRDKGRVPHTMLGDTEFFLSDDVIRHLEDEKIDPREGPLD